MLISVIIPAYNAEKTIEESIKSVLGQDVEIIIVIDGSTDGTLSICQDMQKNNKNILIIEQENKGPFEARQTGIKNAKGKYLVFLDSDDSYTENTIIRVTEVINKYNEPDVVRFRYKKVPVGYDQYKYFEENEKEIVKKDFEKYVYPMFLEGYMLNALWNNCVKKEVIEKLNIETSYAKYGEDLLMNLEIFSNINTVVFINDILYKYYFQEESLTNTKTIRRLFRNLQNAVEVYSKLHLYLIKWGMNTKENVEIVNKRVKKECCDIIEIIKKSQN